jgi:taspase (threonine aspartase 1)
MGGPDPISQLSGPVTDNTIKAMDGATERSLRQGSRSQVSAIFVHAGAGYHSTTNEHIHLGACDECVAMNLQEKRSFVTD